MKDNIYKLDRKLISFFICIVFSNFAFLVFCSFANLSHPDISLTLISLSVMISLFLLLQFKYSRILTLTGIPILLLGIFLFGFIDKGLSSAVAPFVDLYRDFYDIFINYTKVTSSEELIVLLVFSLIISFFTYYFVEVHLNPQALFLFATVALMLQLIMGGFKSSTYFIFLIGICLFAVFFYVYQYMNNYTSYHVSGFTKAVIPAALITLIAFSIACLIPYFELPVISEKLSTSSKENFSYHSFNEDDRSGESKLGGTINPENNHVFDALVSTRTKFIGSIKTEYTGNSWKFNERSSTKYIGQKSIDALEFEYNSEYSEKVLGVTPPLNFVKSTVSDISAKTDTVFVPPLLYYFDGSSDSPFYLCSDGSMMSKGLNRESSYITEGYKVDFNDASVRNFLNKSHKDFYDKIKSFNSSADVSLASLKKKSQDIYSSCLTLPDTLPQRVYALAKEITAGKKTNFEKAVAIEEYLSSYPYTFKTSDLPSDADFVDYFLFVEKKGYCTYYASAMAVLCRCVGIPTRYVEGYTLPLNFADVSEHGYLYNVTEIESHTWPQIYLEGAGWIDFEPTAPYRYIERGGALPDDIFESEEDKAQFEETTKGNEESTTKDSAEEETRGEEISEETTEPETQTETEDVTKPKPEEKSSKGGFKIALTVIAIIVFILLIIFMTCTISKAGFNRKWNRLRKTMAPSRAIKMLYREILNTMKYAGIVKKPHETMGEFFERANEILNLSASPENIINRVTFGNKIATEAERTTVLDYFDRLREAVLADMNPTKRLIVTEFLHKL